MCRAGLPGPAAGHPHFHGHDPDHTTDPALAPLTLAAEIASKRFCIRAQLPDMHTARLWQNHEEEKSKGIGAQQFCRYQPLLISSAAPYRLWHPGLFTGQLSVRRERDGQ